jgi:hypothetical protein
MDYKMRDLKTSDIFKMSKILKKVNLKIEVENRTNQMQAGLQFFQKIAENIHLAENETNEFLGGLVGLSGDQFAELQISETIEIISQFKNQKGIDGFLKLASK